MKTYKHTYKYKQKQKQINALQNNNNKKYDISQVNDQLDS